MERMLNSDDKPEFEVNTFDVNKRRKKIIIFKLGKPWVFKHFFDNKELFLALLGNYNKDQYRLSSRVSARGTMHSSCWSGTASIMNLLRI
jgi:hypothetical protein